MGTRIVAVAHAVPDRAVTSNEVEQRVAENSPGFELPRGLIALMAGVRERRYAAPGTTSSDLASAAATRALTRAGVHPASIDLVVFASASHDVAEPATANLVQEKVGCVGAAVVDVKNACNSFLNGLDIACAYIETGRADRVLVATGEVLSPAINWCIEDSVDLQRKFAALTLGDAGAAAVLEASPDPDRGVFAGTFFSDGTQWGLSTILGGGTLMWHDTSRMFFECNSSELQKLAVGHLPELIRKAVEQRGWQLDDVRMVVPHQVSVSVISAICREVGFPRNRCVVTLDRFGNTAAASIPLALSVNAAKLADGDKVLLVGGAAGFSGGVVPLVWQTP